LAVYGRLCWAALLYISVHIPIIVKCA
jgi:hypothetical protein